MPTIWQHAIGMAVNIHTDGPALKDFAKRLKSAAFSGIMIQAHEGSQPKYTADQLRDYLYPFRELGMLCGTWGYLKTDPAKDAETANMLSRASNSHFYVGNAEIEYKYTAADGSQCLICFERSAEFVENFRALRPTLPLGISSYGRFDQANIHWAAWLNDGDARALPQAYMNEQGGSWSPTNCFRGAIDVKQPHNPMYNPRTKAVIPGFPKSYVHVTIAKPDPHDKYVFTIQNWISALLAARNAGHPLGFSAYEIENFTASDLAALGDAIRAYNLAAIR